MAILLLGGTVAPALSQSSPASNSIVINEVEINPINGAEFVELYNTTSQPIDISGWLLAPSTTWKTLEIQSNTIIEPQSFLAFTHHSSWFKDFGDTISLTNTSGELIDETPLLADLDDDGNTWQRNTDGLDTDSATDWELKRMTPRTSNGKIIEIEETIFSFSGQTDKTEYVFGDTLTISGNVSENLFKNDGFSSPEIINIDVEGQNYFNNIELYPDRNLSFSTTSSIQNVYGFTLGDYDVEISYGENSIQTSFTITDELTSSTETVSEDLELSTDKESYIPGETVTLFGNTNSLIEYAGLVYTVTDPNGKQIFEGTIFQNPNFSIVHQAGGGQIYPFSTQMFMQTVNPVYGTYEIQGTYKSLDPYSDSAEIDANTTFQVVQDVRDESIFSLSTDKEIYSISDTIFVTGRSNQIWTENIALEVQQTGVLTRSTDPHKGHYVHPDPFTLNESVYLNGDGTFEFQFKVANSGNVTEDLSRFLGDYRLTVSEYFGNAHVSFKIVDNPESFVDIRTPLGLQMDKPQYVLGTAFTVSGKVLDYDHKDPRLNNVIFTIFDPTGNQLTNQMESRYLDGNTPGQTSKLTFTAIPDVIGNYQISAVLTPLQFDLGKYTITATHPVLKISESVEFEVVSAQSEILPPTETQEPLIFEICSSTRGDISEILKDLKQIGKGEIPPSMESVNCDGTTNFKTGEKLVIRGQVIPKQITSLDQSSVKTSGQTQEGSSYSTNYAQAQFNYVQLAIPYPQTLIIQSAMQTVPDADEDYHGGGGSGSASTQDQTTGTYVGTGSKSEANEPSNRNTGYNGQIVYKEIKKNLIEMDMKVYPDSEGNFHGVFDLRAGIFVDGIYKIKADYFGYKHEQNFSVIDNSLKGGLAPEITIDFDKDEYIPGETVSISGKISNVYYYDPVSVIIETPDVSQINCLVGQQCGFGNSEKKIRVNEGTEGATFYMNYKIPSGDSSVGKYNVIADTHFGEIKKSFFVLSESDVVGQISPPSSEITPKTSKIIEKFNRIADTEIPIILSEKSSEDSILVPRVIQGSLFTSARGEESDVNLRITTTAGQCIIGQGSDCLVSESTRKPGAIYSIVSIDDVNYKIRYSGDDVRLEKFSILPENSNSKIDIDDWNVEIIKDEQPTRFYYKVSYVALE
ncbi:lamin tail domain-containing protein [Candidatus Nitrosopelagicus sp.]|nr:lamin tail domain-containing protein [Candidatus Nitrosopelagicus sp.]